MAFSMDDVLSHTKMILERAKHYSASGNTEPVRSFVLDSLSVLAGDIAILAEAIKKGHTPVK